MRDASGHANRSFAIAPPITTTTEGLIDVRIVIVKITKTGMRDGDENFLPLIDPVLPDNITHIAVTVQFVNHDIHILGVGFYKT